MASITTPSSSPISSMSNLPLTTSRVFCISDTAVCNSRNLTYVYFYLPSLYSIFKQKEYSSNTFFNAPPILDAQYSIPSCLEPSLFMQSQKKITKQPLSSVNSATTSWNFLWRWIQDKLNEFNGIISWVYLHKALNKGLLLLLLRYYYYHNKLSYTQKPNQTKPNRTNSPFGRTALKLLRGTHLIGAS